LVTHPDAKVRSDVLYAVHERIQRLRSAPAQLVPLIEPALHDVDKRVREKAFDLPGAASAVHADFLAVTAGIHEPVVDPDDVELSLYLSHDSGPFDAMNTLMRLGDPRWVPVVSTALVAGGNAADWFEVPDADLVFDPAVLAAVTLELTALTAQAPDRRDTHAAIAWLVKTLGIWGPAAAFAETAVQRAAPWAADEAARTLAAMRTEPEPSDCTCRYVDDVSALLAAVAEPWRHPEALPRLVELGAVDAVPRLKQLLAQDERVIAEEHDWFHIWADEEFCRRLRDALSAIGSHRGDRGGGPAT
jgi:hypothetical protein